MLCLYVEINIGIADVTGHSRCYREVFPKLKPIIFGGMIMKKSFILGFAILLLAGLFTAACQNKDGKEEEHDIMNGIAPDPGGDFDYTLVWVELTEAAAILDKEWTPSDFPGFAFSKIDVAYYVHPRGYLVFYLAEPGRENVLRAVYYLNQRPEIKRAWEERLDDVPMPNADDIWEENKGE